MKVRSINRQVLILMLVVTIIPILLLSALYLYSYDQNFKKQKFEQLSLIADKKSTQISNYIEERIGVAVLTAHSASSVEGLKVLIPQFKERLINQEVYRQLQKSYRDKLQFALDRGFYDIFLISPSRDILLSLKGEEDLYTNLTTGLYAESELAKQVNKAFSLEESSLSKFTYYLPSKADSAFIAVSVLENNQVLGVIAFQLGIEKLTAVVRDNTGLGLTGKSQLAYVDNQQLFLITGTDTKNGFTKVNGTPIFLAGVMQQAVTGDSGYGIVKD
ncbi:MAG: hypothetical protein QM500_11485, partial [Methylococcales bacterium]